MGNAASKKARRELLEAVEQNYALAEKTLSERNMVLARTESQLQESRTEHTNVSNEAARLRDKREELDALFSTLEQERLSRINSLNEGLKQATSEVAAQKRVIEIGTQERDQLKKLFTGYQEDAKSAEATSEAARCEFEAHKKKLEADASSRSAELEESKSKLANTAARVHILEDRNKSLSEDLASTVRTAALELSASKASAAEELAVVKEAAASELANAKHTAATELEAFKTTAAEQIAAAEADALAVRQSLASLSAQLDLTKASLISSTSRFDTLQRTYNESVSRRLGVHEAFTATKLELSETQEKYRELYKEQDLLIHSGSEKIMAAEKALADEQEARRQVQARLDELQQSILSGDGLKLGDGLCGPELREVTV